MEGQGNLDRLRCFESDWGSSWRTLQQCWFEKCRGQRRVPFSKVVQFFAAIDMWQGGAALLTPCESPPLWRLASSFLICWSPWGISALRSADWEVLLQWQGWKKHTPNLEIFGTSPSPLDDPAWEEEELHSQKWRLTYPGPLEKDAIWKLWKIVHMVILNKTATGFLHCVFVGNVNLALKHPDSAFLQTEFLLDQESCEIWKLAYLNWSNFKKAFCWFCLSLHFIKGGKFKQTATPLHKSGEVQQHFSVSITFPADSVTKLVHLDMCVCATTGSYFVLGPVIHLAQHCALWLAPFLQGQIQAETFLLKRPQIQLETYKFIFQFLPAT